MNWITTKYNQAVNLNEIPVISISELREDIIHQIKNDKRVVGFFGVKEPSKIRLYVVLANDIDSEILIASSVFDENGKYTSITAKIPSFHRFEREFYEEFGIEPLGHPWLKPVRYSKNRFNKTQVIENYPFFKMDGEEVHEVAVGPIHAGIIEPGHFRFICNGEKVYDLEIQLGYQHRNIEQLFLQNKGFSSHLAESIAGDTVIAHSLAYSQAIEALLDIKISNKASIIRIIALELERIAVHIGDLGTISNDIAYLMGNAVFGATRTLVINTMLEICGSRLGRGLIRVGGVVYNIDNAMSVKIIEILEKVLKDTERMTYAMFASASVLSRLEKTGILNKEKAVEIGLIGMAARASGVPLDGRVDHPCGIYKELSLVKQVMTGGDAYARTYIRYEEIVKSVEIIKKLLYKLANFENEPLLTENTTFLSPNKMVVSMTEGWRGETIHAVLTGESGNITRYKIKDASFNNWYGLALAVRNNGISDFPLCNKSFNLSYCGNDL